KADELRSLLNPNEVQLGDAFSPIHIHRAHIRIVAHYFFDTAGDFPKFRRIWPHHPKSNGEGRVRSKYQLRRPNPRFRCQAVGGRLAQAQFEMIPCLRILGQNHNFGEGGIGQLRVVGKEKPWSTRSDIGCTIFDSGCSDSQCSIFFVAALVVSMLVPNGSWTSTNNSGRSEFGKNCFFTTAIPPAAMRNAPTTMPPTVYFFLTHHMINWRSRWYPGAE